MPATAIAEGVASNLAAKALELVAKEAVKKAASWWRARADLKKLSEFIELIRARVGDAERQQEGENREAIRVWLGRLTQVLYRADDLFDEVLTLDLLKQQEMKKQEMEKSMLCKVGILFTAKFGPLCYNIKLANEIKSIRKEFDAINSEMATLNLSNLPAQGPPPLMEKRETSSFLKKYVIGRENDQNIITELLLNPKNTFITIVGFGGLGKTTLAQLVFNDERVTQHFELTRWAYVPDIDYKIVMGKIYRTLTNKNYNELSLEEIQRGITEFIETKKFLLVLDDIWDEGDDIKEYLSLLERGKHGSKVIVTTRSVKVAKHFGSIQATHKLGTLTDEQSWELFEKVAFGPEHEDDKSALIEIGEQIVKMCKNVPLVIRIIGASLYPKFTREQWLEVKNDLSKAKLDRNDEIMPILKLSYDYLSPESKLCFAYCSLFPKGYEFEKDDLVHLWMAQGYIELDKGTQYFTDLVARNLFQGPKVVSDVEIYEMHDLLHDLAKEVAGDWSIIYERPDQILDRLVHVNLSGYTSPPSLKDANRLRSLLHIGYDAHDEELFSKFKSLRVLRLKHYSSSVMVPNSIGRLLHLRYLNLEEYEIRYLPDSITRLVHLQTLNLKSCSKLQELPRDIGELFNLRHLLLPECLSDLPQGFGNLKSLQELNRFVVGKSAGIDSLPALNLKGALVINFEMWRRDAVEEAKMVNLKNNLQLTSLRLILGAWGEKSTPPAGEMKEMLRCLQLSPFLRDLRVEEYRGYEMPVCWLDGLSHLASIELSVFRQCKVLPKMSGLLHLKSLKLFVLNELKYVEEEDEDNIKVGTTTATHNRCFFPSLKFLEIDCCPKLEGWRRPSKDKGEQRQLVFPCLLKMKVRSCAMLMSMPLAPSMELLEIYETNWRMVESSKVRAKDDEFEVASSSSAPPSSSSSNLYTSLKKVEIEKVKDESISLSIGSVVTIKDCSELRNLRFKSPNSIRELKIHDCSGLKSISEGLQHLSRLDKLDICGCDELELEEEEEEEGKTSRGRQGLSSLRELNLKRIPKVKTLSRGIACVTTLQQLHLKEMENLRELPQEIGNLSLLRELHIEGCPQVKSLPQSILFLPKLQVLQLWHMKNLQLWERENLHLWNREALAELAREIGHGNLPLLSHLEIKDCPKITSFHTSVLDSLQTLTIEGCPDIGKKCMPCEEDWHLLDNIPNLTIVDGSRKYRRIDGKDIPVGSDCYSSDGS